MTFITGKIDCLQTQLELKTGISFVQFCQKSVVFPPISFNLMGWTSLILATVCFGLWGYLSKVSQIKGASNWVLTVLVCLGTVIVSLFICMPFIDFENLKAQKHCILPGVLAGVSVGIGNIFLFQSIQTIPASVAFPVVSLNLLVTVILAVVFLKESLSIYQMIGIVFAVLAAILLSK